MRIPEGLQARRRLGPDWAAWVDVLPRRCDDLLAEWRLTPVGEPLHGFASVVVPVRGADGAAAMLKVGFDGAEETAQEHLALRIWDGDGAVRLYRADPARRALLLERLGAEGRSAVDLSTEWDLRACELVAGFYPRLHRPAPKRFPALPRLLDGWLTALETDAHAVPMPRRMVDQALALGRDLVVDPNAVGTIVHGDLHYGNVLAAEREPWLVIDPQPVSGDPHYEVAPLLWNRWDEMAGYLRESIRRRFAAVVETAGFDDERARDWVIVRMVLNAHWAVEDARRAGRRLDADEHDWITRCISVVKAVQD
ncbi:MAG: aminoglycoside phosphotransferase family protein [Gordonia sp. (in: high G+C Gram-positive bacteria)]|uniref:aminoglycoside phosphotransferase family protein n=1 Tax=Gordonia sp. (in: high G+C Gram-positive bacteria) TaxID=84139 RepID=UPI0039E4B271